MLIIDRFEGNWAVVEMDRQTFNLPKDILPKDAKEGDVIELYVTINQKATEERRQAAKKILENFFDE